MIDNAGRNLNRALRDARFHLFQSTFALSLTEQVDHLYAAGGDCRDIGGFPRRDRRRYRRLRSSLIEDLHIDPVGIFDVQAGIGVV